MVLKRYIYIKIIKTDMSKDSCCLPRAKQQDNFDKYLGAKQKFTLFYIFQIISYC